MLWQARIALAVIAGAFVALTACGESTETNDGARRSNSQADGVDRKGANGNDLRLSKVATIRLEDHVYSVRRIVMDADGRYLIPVRSDAFPAYVAPLVDTSTGQVVAGFTVNNKTVYHDLVAILAEPCLVIASGGRGSSRSIAERRRSFGAMSIRMARTSWRQPRLLPLAGC